MSIKLTIVSDIICPWCIIGYKRYDSTVTELGVQEQVELEWQPFELNPDMAPEGEELSSYFYRKYGMSPEEGARSREMIARLGAEVGFTFDFFDTMRKYNTRNGHILLEYAREQGKQTALQIRLFEAYFSERKDISDRDILFEEVKAVGLDPYAALDRLDCVESKDMIAARTAHWQGKGISSVPTMIIDNSVIVTGAQSLSEYKRLIRQFINA